MALYGRLFSLVRPSQFYVHIFESRLGRIIEIPLYLKLLLRRSPADVRLLLNDAFASRNLLKMEPLK